MTTYIVFDEVEPFRRDKSIKNTKNCLHGQIPFPIRYMPGVRPTGDHIYHANIDGLAGGPYLLNESQHRILHEERRGHQHVFEDKAPKTKLHRPR